MTRDPKQPFGYTAPKVTAQDFAPPKRITHPLDLVIPLCCVALTVALIWALYITVTSASMPWSLA